VLSDDDRHRIEQDEQLREQVRRIFNEEQKDLQFREASSKSPLRRLTAFLQTSLGTALIIWFLSSIVVTALSEMQKDAAADRETSKLLQRIRTEVAVRTREAEAQVTRMNSLVQGASNTVSSPEASARYIYNLMSTAPTRGPEGSQPANVHPEYKEVSLYGLVALYAELTDFRSLEPLLSRLDQLSVDALALQNRSAQAQEEPDRLMRGQKGQRIEVSREKLALDTKLAIDEIQQSLGLRD
jgi:hypothetical protein